MHITSTSLCYIQLVNTYINKIPVLLPLKLLNDARGLPNILFSHASDLSTIGSNVKLGRVNVGH